MVSNQFTLITFSDTKISLHFVQVIGNCNWIHWLLLGFHHYCSTGQNNKYWPWSYNEQQCAHARPHARTHTRTHAHTHTRRVALGGTALTLFRKPFSTLAAFTDRDLGMRMGFSRMTIGEKKRDREGERRKIVSREEDDSQSNLPVGDHVCWVGVKGGAEIQRTVLFFSHFWWSTHSLETPTALQCHTTEKKNSVKNSFPSKCNKGVALPHTVVLQCTAQGYIVSVWTCLLSITTMCQNSDRIV